MRWGRTLGLGLTALLLAGCAAEVASVKPGLRPKARPAAQAAPLPPSAESEALRVYYSAIQSDQISRGLLRTDGGGPDTPFTDTMLAENFVRIALYDEYTRGKDGFTQAEVPSPLRRWAGPVKVGVVFGPSTPVEKRGIEKARIGSYLSRLSRLTGHPIALADDGANFHLFILNEDERRAMGDQFGKMLPELSAAEVAAVVALPRSTYCLVYAMSVGGSSVYSRAFALIRAEQPDLRRMACLHEEVAQGLGLANDHPQARPSVFNDDEEFATLTVMDEYLLRILYDARLRPGMTEAEARPIVQQIATEILGGGA